MMGYYDGRGKVTGKEVSVITLRVGEVFSQEPRMLTVVKCRWMNQNQTVLEVKVTDRQGEPDAVYFGLDEWVTVWTREPVA